MNCIKNYWTENYLSKLLFLIVISSVIILNLSFYVSGQVTINNIDKSDAVLEGNEFFINISASSNTSSNTTSNETTQITYKIFIDNVFVSSDSYYVWNTEYNDSGEYTVRVEVSDDESILNQSFFLLIEDNPLSIEVDGLSDVISSKTINLTLVSSRVISGCSGIIYGNNFFTTLNLQTDDAIVYYQNITFTDDIKYTVDINCSDGYNVVNILRIFYLDTAPLVVSSKNIYSDNDYIIHFSVFTNQETDCKYDYLNRPFDEMMYAFDGESTRNHSAILRNLPDGIYTFYFSCSKNENIVSQTDSLTITLARKPSAQIKIDGTQPIKAGTYEISLVTSKPVQNNPSLTYYLDGDNTQRSISLSGSGDKWKGYMIINSNFGNRVASFRYSGTDFSGVTGSIITSGEVFLIDTLVPEKIDFIKATPQDKSILLEWHYTGEKIKTYNIYRAIDSDPMITDYYYSTSSDKELSEFMDENIGLGQIYYYKVSAVDKAGNEGPLSDSVSTSSISIDNIEKNLSQRLVPKVDSLMVDVTGYVLDMDSIRERLLKSDQRTLNVLDILHSVEILNNARSELNSTLSDLIKLKTTDLSESDLDVRLNKFKQDLIRTLSKVVEKVEIVETGENTQVLSDSDFSIPTNIVLSGKNVSMNQFSNISNTLKKTSDSIVVKYSMYAIKLKYYNAEDFDRYTIVVKNIASSSKITNAMLIEYVPKTLEDDYSNIDFSYCKYLDPQIISDSESFIWKLNELENAQIIYKFSGLKDMSEVSRTRTFIAPTIKIVDDIKTPAPITGFVVLPTKMPKISGLWTAVFLGIVSILILFFYYVSIPAGSNMQSSNMNKLNMSKENMYPYNVIQVQKKQIIRPLPNKKIITQMKNTVPINKNITGSKPIIGKGSHVTVSDINSRPVLDKNSLDVSNINSEYIFKTQKSKEDELINYVTQTNNLINDLEYQKSLKLYRECITSFKTTVFTSGEKSIFAADKLEEIYIKLSLFDHIYSARKSVIKRDMKSLKKSLKYLKFYNEWLVKSRPEKNSSEENFRKFVEKSKVHLEKFS